MLEKIAGSLTALRPGLPKGMRWGSDKSGRAYLHRLHPATIAQIHTGKFAEFPVVFHLIHFLKSLRGSSTAGIRVPAGSKEKMGRNRGSHSGPMGKNCIKTAPLGSGEPPVIYIPSGGPETRGLIQA